MTTTIGWARWEDSRNDPPRRLVAPHRSQLAPETPAGELAIPSLAFTLAELRGLFQIMEDGTYLPDEAPADGGTFHGVEITWRRGGQTSCATKDLSGVQKPADISTVEGRAAYADGSTLTAVFRPGQRGRRAAGRIQWTGIGEARERAEAMDAYTEELNHGRRKLMATVAESTPVAAVTIALPAAIVALVCGYGVRAAIASGHEDSLGWIALPLPIALVAGGLWLYLANKLCVDGRIVRTRSQPDWIAITGLATVIGTFLTGLLGLLTILFG